MECGDAKSLSYLPITVIVLKIHTVAIIIKNNLNKNVFGTFETETNMEGVRLGNKRANESKHFRRKVVFVDPDDPEAPHWWPAMVRKRNIYIYNFFKNRDPRLCTNNTLAKYSNIIL